MSRRLSEATVILIRDYLKTALPAALLDVKSDRGYPAVTLEPPQNYFIYPKARGYKTPAIFVIDTGTDFRQDSEQSNFVNALVRIDVSVLVEDRDRERLTFKAWRNQAALHEVLEQANVTSADQKVKLTVVVKRARPTPVYTDAANEESPDALFRKEVLLECDVTHRENY